MSMCDIPRNHSLSNRTQLLIDCAMVTCLVGEYNSLDDLKGLFTNLPEGSLYKTLSITRLHVLSFQMLKEQGIPCWVFVFLMIMASEKTLSFCQLCAKA